MEWLWIILGIAVGFGIAWLFRIIAWTDRERALRAEFSQWHQSQIKGERADALNSSRRVLAGKYLERFIPFTVPYEPADMHFLGSPVDYVIFSGLYDDRCEEIIFLEVKSNNATVTKRERAIRDAVRAGKVRWEEVQRDV